MDREENQGLSRGHSYILTLRGYREKKKNQLRRLRSHQGMKWGMGEWELNQESMLF